MKTSGACCDVCKQSASDMDLRLHLIEKERLRVCLLGLSGMDGFSIFVETGKQLVMVYKALHFVSLTKYSQSRLFTLSSEFCRRCNWDTKSLDIRYSG